MKKKSFTLNQLIKAIDLRATLDKKINIKILDVADLVLQRKTQYLFFLILYFHQ